MAGFLITVLFQIFRRLCLWKKILKSVSFWRRYGQKLVGTVLWTTWWLWLFKAKYCPPVVPVASTGSTEVTSFSEWHFINNCKITPPPTGSSISCTREKHTTPCDLELWFMILKSIEQNFINLSAARFMSYHVNRKTAKRKKIIDDARNNTAVVSAGSNKICFPICIREETRLRLHKKCCGDVFVCSTYASTTFSACQVAAFSRD